MIKFKDVKRKKSLGRISEGNSIGISTTINAEVLSAEYAKDQDGNVKSSQAGNKQIKLNCKVDKPVIFDNGESKKIPQFFNVTYYEHDWSPDLKSVKPTDKLSKFVEVRYNTGGKGSGDRGVFGHVSLRNYKNKDGDLKSSVSIFGANIQKAIKRNGTYTIKDFDGNDEVFVKDEDIKVSLKGFIQNINDTEKFIKENYNKKSKRLDFDMYYLENEEDSKYDNIMPASLENIPEDRVMQFIEFVKKTSSNVVGVMGKVRSYPIYKEVEEPKNNSGGFGEYSFDTKEKVGYEVRLVINYDESVDRWVLSKTSNTGTLVLEDGDFPFDDDGEDLFS